MKDIINKNHQGCRTTLFLKLFIFMLALGWLLSTASVDGHAAASKNQTGKSISGAQRENSAAQDNLFDTSDVPKKQQREWAGIQNKLAKEYSSCTDDCGNNIECQERCWNVYEFRLDREHLRITHEAQ